MVGVHLLFLTARTPGVAGGFPVDKSTPVETPPARAPVVRESPQTRSRFHKPYPPDAPEIEITARLQALKRTEDRTLLVEVLLDEREHWIVKRTALRRLAREGFHSEAERDRLLGALDPRTIATATLTDEELVQRSLE